MRMAATATSSIGNASQAESGGGGGVRYTRAGEPCRGYYYSHGVIYPAPMPPPPPSSGFVRTSSRSNATATTTTVSNTPMNSSKKLTLLTSDLNLINENQVFDTSALLVNAGNANNKVGCCVLEISADTVATTTNTPRTITTWILFFSLFFIAKLFL